MQEISKYDVVCLERGDISYLNYVANQLSSRTDLADSELKNYAEALRGIARAATELENI